MDYRTKHSSENNVDGLRKLLLSDRSGKIYNEDEKIAVGEMLKNEIKQDFETGKIVIVKGWVLSITEARQCALYSLSES